MPNKSPLSRYLLVGFAVLMFASVLPDAGMFIERVRQSKQNRVTRTVIIDGVRVR